MSLTIKTFIKFNEFLVYVFLARLSLGISSFGIRLCGIIIDLNQF
jgi:hypothetical protein